ncbi:MAG: SMI1/KNR4 family protein [Deltaproteobacteria bacterium]|nr:SMI1/KNR4 family protein [Deltaproteobacteria bacterium]
MFDDLDLASFWEDSSANEEYVEEPPSAETVTEVERALGYRLPAAYVALAQHQNGGLPVRTNHRTAEPTTWSEDHVAVNGIFSIGSAKPSSLCGELGSRFWVEEWGYPEIGVYFADCPSAGHDMLCLDYRACGPEGEPRVVHVDQERDYRITFVAESFEAFIRGLEGDEAFE